jgi:uncharacterized membrane protein YiaA
MKIIDTILLFSAAALFIIGVHQVMVGNFHKNYWLFMMMIALLGLYQLRKKNREDA